MIQFVFRYVVMVSFLGLFSTWANASGFRLTPVELQQLQQQQSVRLIDARVADVYRSNHLPNAVNLPYLSTFQEFSHSGRMISTNEAKQLLSQLGIQNSDVIVAYDSGEMVYAARILWFLEVLGHKHVYLLDGGFKAWQAQGYAVSQQLPMITPSQYVPSIDTNKYATRITTLIASKKPDSFYIIDARDEDHFLGLQSDAKRYGHIPNAHGIDYHLNLDPETGYLRSEKELAKLYADVPKDKKIITYCSAGIASSLVYLVLKEQGYDVANYDASWVEWGNDTSLPIVSPTRSPSSIPNTPVH